MNLLAGCLTMALVLLSGRAWVRIAVGPCAWAPALAISHLVGSALAAAGATVSLALTGRAPWWATLLPGVVVLLRSVLVRSDATRAPGAPEASGASGWPSAPRVLFLLLALGVATAACRVAWLPLDWDGWAFWQLKAKALADGSLQTLLQDPLYRYAHPDYPLLNPVQTWLLSGFGFNDQAAQVGGFLFLLDLLILFHHEARRRVPGQWALAGCVVIVSWAVTMKHAASGFSDLILAAYVLAVAAPLARGDHRLLGPMLCGAVLTKNEGLFTLAGCGVWLLLLAHRRAIADRGWQSAYGWGAGFLAALAWTILKRRWQLYSDLLDPGEWSPAFIAELPGRLGVVAAGFARQFLFVGPWYPGWGLLWPFCLAGVALTVRRRVAGVAALWIVCAAHFAGTAAAYVVTGADPALHLDRSLDRLLLHVAPVALLAGIVAVVATLSTDGPPQQGDGPSATAADSGL